MKNEEEAMEQFIVEAAVEGLNEIFCEGSYDRDSAFQTSKPRLENMEVKLKKNIEGEIKTFIENYTSACIEDDTASDTAIKIVLDFIDSVRSRYSAQLKVRPGVNDAPTSSPSLPASDAAPVKSLFVPYRLPKPERIPK